MAGLVAGGGPAYGECVRAPVIVGAGPAGLAAAAELKRAGIEPLVLERADCVGAAWRDRRYDRLRLHTARRLSALPHAPIPRAYGRWVARDDFLAYLDAFARTNGIEPRLGVNVERIDRADGGWRVSTSDGSLDAGHVVVATGYSNVPYTPDWPGADAFRGEVVHSSDYRNPSLYAGRDVLVVGAGNSGAEIAVDLVEGGARKVWLSVRTPPNIVRRDRLGVPSQVIGIAVQPLPERALNVVGRVLRRLTVPDLTEFGLPAPRDGYTQLLRTGTVPILDIGIIDAVRSRRVEVVPAVERFDGAHVVLSGGVRLTPDAVIAATGYRPALEPLVGHLGVLDERGTPLVHGADTHRDAPGLHFVAISIRLGGLIREAAREASAAARAIAHAESLDDTTRSTNSDFARV
jgi:putative flavoprotein involved in K+ transport